MNDYKRTILKLYFKELLNKYNDFDEYSLDELLPYEQPTKYIVESENYDNSFKIPVLTAGKIFILGYTNEKNGIFEATPEKPVIIFDDFTTASKYVDFNFKVKSSAMKILHISELVNPKFIYYLMQTLDIDSTTHKRYWISKYAKITVTIPSKEIQDYEAKRLDKIIKYIQEMEENYNEILGLKETLVNKILENAVHGILVKNDKSLNPVELEEIEDDIPYDIPANWKWTSVEKSCSLTSGVSLQNEYESGDYLYVKVGDMNLPENQKEIVTSSRYTIEREAKSIIPINSIIFPKRGGAISTNKKRLVIKKPICVDLNTMAITPCDQINIYYLYYWFSLINLGSLNNGTSVPQINNKDMNPLKIPVPPIKEQEIIVNRINSLFEVIEQF